MAWRVRDRYRTRMERGVEAGTTEIYISHRGAEQTYIGDDAPLGQQDDIGKMVWQPRPSDPRTRGGDALPADALPRSRRAACDGGRCRGCRRRAPDAFRGPGRRHAVDRARRGLLPSMAADRCRTRPRRFHPSTDRDRSRGLYFLQYASREDGAQNRKSGWLSRLKFWEDAKADEGVDTYLVRVVGETETTSSIVVLDEEGNPQATPAARRILNRAPRTARVAGPRDRQSVGADPSRRCRRAVATMLDPADCGRGRAAAGTRRRSCRRPEGGRRRRTRLARRHRRHPGHRNPPESRRYSAGAALTLLSP